MQNFIDGKWWPSQSGRTIPIVNPATGEQIDTVPVSKREIVRSADFLDYYAEEELRLRGEWPLMGKRTSVCWLQSSR